MRSPARSRKKTRIKEIASQIAELSTELQNLLNLSDGSDEDSPSPKPSHKNTTGESVVVGDRVVILRDQKGNTGKKGKVTSTSRYYVWIRLDHIKVTVQKRRSNVTTI